MKDGHAAIACFVCAIIGSGIRTEADMMREAETIAHAHSVAAKALFEVDTARTAGVIEGAKQQALKHSCGMSDYLKFDKRRM